MGAAKNGRRLASLRKGGMRMDVSEALLLVYAVALLIVMFLNAKRK
jgi:hypothetical protein